MPPTTTTNSGKLFIGQIRPQALAFLRRSLFVVNSISKARLSVRMKLNSVGMHSFTKNLQCIHSSNWLRWERDLSLVISLLLGRPKESRYILLLFYLFYPRVEHVPPKVFLTKHSDIWPIFLLNFTGYEAKFKILRRFWSASLCSVCCEF